jgi:hypothetical protein
MQRFAYLRQNRLHIAGFAIIAVIIAGIVIYVRRPVAPEEYAVYAVVIHPDHILFYETSEGIDLDAELASQVGLSLTTGSGWGNKVSRVTFSDNGTKAWVRVGYSACGSDHDYIMSYKLLKDSAGWHKVSEELIREVFC